MRTAGNSRFIVFLIAVALVIFVCTAIGVGMVVSKQTIEAVSTQLQSPPQPSANDTQLNPNPVEVRDYLSISAEMLTLTRDELVATLGSERTIADFAQAQGVEPQAIIDALVAADEEVIQTISAEGDQSDAEIATLRAASVEFNTELVFNPLPQELPDDAGDVPFNPEDYPEDNELPALGETETD